MPTSNRLPPGVRNVTPVAGAVCLAALCALAPLGCSRADGAPPAAATLPAASDPARIVPNTPLVTHEDEPVHFYDDLVKGRKVLIHFMYTVCDGI